VKRDWLLLLIKTLLFDFGHEIESFRVGSVWCLGKDFGTGIRESDSASWMGSTAMDLVQSLQNKIFWHFFLPNQIPE
jgi:hypothetical protein